MVRILRCARTTPTPIAPDTMLYICRARCRTFGPPSLRLLYIIFRNSTSIAWQNSSTTATIVQTVHLLQLDSTTYLTTLSTMTTYPHLLRSSSETLSLPGSPLSVTTPLSVASGSTMRAESPQSPLLTEDEELEQQAWEAYQPERREQIARLLREDAHDLALIQDWQRDNEDNKENVPRRLFKDPKPATCRCGLFQPCQDCRMYLTRESLAMGLKTRSRSPTTSEEESSQDSDSQESDLGLEPRDGRPDISCLQPLKVVSTGRIKNLLISVKLLEQSTEYHESSMLMEDIIFTLSSTSSESSSSRTATVSASENRQATLVQSARLKLIAIYYQLRAHPSTLGTTSASMVTSFPKTAKDRALAVLTSHEMTCGPAAWLLQTKKNFYSTCKSILRETSYCSTNKSRRTPGEPTRNQSLKCPPLKKTVSSFIGSGIRKPGNGSSRTSATQSMQFARLREESPTLLKQRRRTKSGSNYIDLTESDPDDLSQSSYMEILG